jgi:hypothetical protein
MFCHHLQTSGAELLHDRLTGTGQGFLPAILRPSPHKPPIAHHAGKRIDTRLPNAQCARDIENIDITVPPQLHRLET